MITFLLSLVGLAVGGAVGYSFGAIQKAALRRHEKREQAGEFKSAWTVMPGSMTRVAFLLVVLAVIQVLIPVLFDGGMQWVVSGGVVIGYGSTLLKQLRAVV
jgi:membrane protein YqaA with SNARE-associated domain